MIVVNAISAVVLLFIFRLSFTAFHIFIFDKDENKISFWYEFVADLDLCFHVIYILVLFMYFKLNSGSWL